MSTFYPGQPIRVTINATAQYHSPVDDVLTIEYNTDLGTYESNIATDGPDVTITGDVDGEQPTTDQLKAEVERLTDALTAVDQDAAELRMELGRMTIARDVIATLGKEAEGSLSNIRYLHRKHSCDGNTPEDCGCAEDRAEAGGDVCAHCTRPWPCPTAIYAGTKP